MVSNDSIIVEEFIPYVPLAKKEKRKDIYEQIFSTFFVGFLALGMGGCVGFILYEVFDLNF